MIRTRVTAFMLTLTMLVSPVMAFRDVSERSPLAPAVNYLLESGTLKDGSFLRPQEALPQGFFWTLVYKDMGLDIEKVDDTIELPANLFKHTPLAPYLRQAIEDGYIDGSADFIDTAPIRRVVALRTLVQTKKIIIPMHVSVSFRDKVSGIPPTARYLAPVEAAYASGILDKKDIENLRPYDYVTREEFINWLYNWHENGEQRKSTVTPPKKDDSPYIQYPYEKRNKKELRTIKKKSKKKPSITINGVLGKPKDRDLAVLEEVMNQINRKYKFESDLNDEKRSEMLNKAIVGMVQELGDKYSVYIEPAKVKGFKETLNGKFEGIGAYVDLVDGKFTITAPITGSPAEKAGLKANDVVISVDGESIKELSISESISKIKGPSGSKVMLTIMRKNSKKEITVTRGQITIPALKLEWKEGIPVIGIHQFSRYTGEDLAKMLKDEVLPKNPKGIVFDLRNNPGGFLTSAVHVGEIFLEKNKTVFSVEYKKKTEVFTTAQKGLLADFDKPMVFLQNKGSASASEILTSMIQDYGVGNIMGATSHGKGTVQEVMEFTNGGSLKITVAKWLSPKKRWIHEKGVVPDTVVEEATQKQKEAKIDPQMNAAIRFVHRNRK